MKTNSYLQILKTLKELKDKYPTYNMGRHLATALADYGDFWGLSDKEISFALNKYMYELEYNIASDIDVNKIVRDAQNLDTILDEDDEEDDL